MTKSTNRRSSSRLQAQSDAECLRRMSQGDAEALEAFYNKYFPRLYRYIYYRVGRDHHHTEEVIHDTMMEALTNAGKYDPERGNVDSWLIMMSRNKIRTMNNTLLHALDKERSWQAVAEGSSVIFADLDQSQQPDIALERKEEKDKIDQIMNSLPASYRTILTMKYEQDLSVREIAERLGKTEKAIESQLTRARNTFRETYDELEKGHISLPKETIPTLPDLDAIDEEGI